MISEGCHRIREIIAPRAVAARDKNQT